MLPRLLYILSFCRTQPASPTRRIKDRYMAAPRLILGASVTGTWQHPDWSHKMPQYAEKPQGNLSRPEIRAQHDRLTPQSGRFGHSASMERRTFEETSSTSTTFISSANIFSTNRFGMFPPCVSNDFRQTGQNDQTPRPLECKLEDFGSVIEACNPLTCRTTIERSAHRH